MARMAAAPTVKRKVAWPTTPQGWCDWWKALDIAFIAREHRERCPLHGRTA